jgi:teichuronic acid biosynthesis glycosyltransferase TuaC
MLGDVLSGSGVRASFVSHPSGSGSVAAGRNVTYVSRRGRDRISRSKLGAVAAGARMIAHARGAVAKSDIVHLHSNGLLIEAAAWLATRFGKPYVVTLYGTDVSAHDRTRNARYGSVVRNASARVFYSRGLLSHAFDLGLAPDPSSVIYAPVSPDFRRVEDHSRAALRRELGISDRRVLLTVKHLRPVGGHDTLLKAMPAILRDYPDALLWLAGDGDLRAILESTCRDLGIERNVRFLGRLGNDTLWKYYAAADLFVLPSHVESWGTVMLESMACGTPVVATDTVGGLEVRENFPEDVTLVPRADVDRLAQGISTALARPRRATRSTHQRIGREFTIEACGAQYLEVYRAALSSRK